MEKLPDGRYKPPSGVVRPGMKGDDVLWVQIALNGPQIMNANLTPDGSYGPKTTEAVKAYQKKYGLAVDGIFGPKSLAKMFEIMGW